MRKNQYEEALFKCEDERFEIDMVIDCNASALRLLEPLAEELALFAKTNGSAGGASGAGAVGGSLFAAATGLYYSLARNVFVFIVYSFAQ